VRRVEDEKMRKNYKLQNTNYKQITKYKLQITKIRGVLQTYFKLSMVNCQLSIINETGLLRNLNYKQITKGGHSLHKESFKLQTMTAFNKSFCGCFTGPGGRFSRKEPPWLKE